MFDFLKYVLFSLVLSQLSKSASKILPSLFCQNTTINLTWQSPLCNLLFSFCLQPPKANRPRWCRVSHVSMEAVIAQVIVEPTPPYPPPPHTHSHTPTPTCLRNSVDSSPALSDMKMSRREQPTECWLFLGSVKGHRVFKSTCFTLSSTIFDLVSFLPGKPSTKSILDEAFIAVSCHIFG